MPTGAESLVGLFGDSSRESAETGTQWRIVQSDANCPPPQISLITREYTRNFSISGPHRRTLTTKKVGGSSAFSEIPYVTEQGIQKAEQRILSAEQGTFRSEQGNFSPRLQVEVPGRSGATFSSLCPLQT